MSDEKPDNVIPFPGGKSGGDEGGGGGGGGKSDGNESNGGGENAIAQFIAARIAPFARHAQPELLLQLAQMLIQENNALSEHVMPKVLDYEKRPFWYVDLHIPGTNKGLRIHTLKNLANLNEVPEKDRLNLLVHHAFMLALLTDGITARGVLQAHGFKYSFGEMEQQTVSPKITLL